MSNDKRFYIRPENPLSEETHNELVEFLVDWVMKCKEDYQKRQKEKDGSREENNQNSSVGSRDE